MVSKSITLLSIHTGMDFRMAAEISVSSFGNFKIPAGSISEPWNLKKAQVEIRIQQCHISELFSILVKKTWCFIC